MSELLKLRDYQEDAVNTTFEAIALGTNRPAVVLPTGAGKTVIFSWMANKWVRDRKSRVLILVHRDELATQTVEKLHAVAPTLKVGVVKGSRNEYANVDVIVGSVQTLRRFNRRAPILNIGLVIVDEAHHAAAESYRNVLDHFGCFTGQTPAVGFSATLVRSDKGDLSEVWQRVVCQRDILDLIPKYLCDVRGKLVTVDGLSLGEIKTTRGDFSESSLTDALLTAEAQRFVVDAFFEHARDRKTIVFTPTVAAARAFNAQFIASGVRSAVIWGTMPQEDRRLVLKQFASGELEVIVNCMVLTEGFDEPSASCAIIARPTKSAALYVQMVGRVLRKHPSKRDALVLDVVGASQDHKLATLADLTSRRVPEVEPGESLMEAATRERKRGNPNLSNYVVNTDDVDLFHRSPSMWLKTYEGVWFISTRCATVSVLDGVCAITNNTRKCTGHIWFLWPDANELGTYKVGVRPSYGNGGKFLREGLDLETAMSWAEQFAVEEDKTLANRSASWRRKAEKPSEQQKDFAERLGLEFPENITKRDLSDIISIHVASSRLDRAIKTKAKV
jgi:superfamily II DNA or RNA helicase